MFDVQKLGLTDYRKAWELQKELIHKVDQGDIPDQFVLLEHPHTLTCGRGSHQENLLLSVDEYQANGIEVIDIDRGGDVTYHGPGQLVGYPIFKLYDAKKGAHGYLRDLEEVIIETIAKWGIKGARRTPYTGVWVGDRKIAAIGVKFNHGRYHQGYITSHGCALNVNTDLSYFNMIVPCGIKEYGVTSMQEILGEAVEMEDVINELTRQAFTKFA
ncbi:lipoyl(octanoyl) transferase LipB [Hazenella sp. IB182357]|uniref:Octanoyltransferase n=1 Tax=Polycladospora coralii TaxID=2771432 RepID=A0A926RUH8_9BACL|nr:lipoyl(octanoyl) transferase LipB [Polycladospora coralii]MBD1372988.1 lipoyl(octanoyl) transferase LipB [Polycladospora coralii]MBS7530953.1 lipoyl(octanoyl) transferase LipB [Polycladospora coralii]